MKRLSALGLLAIAFNSQAATSLEIQVADTLAPPACDITLGNNGMVAYGTIQPAQLNGNAYTVLEEKKINMNITCQGATQVAMRVISNRRNTLAGATEAASNGSGLAPVALFGQADAPATGLGLANGVQVGGFAVRLTPGAASADGARVDAIHSDTGDRNQWNRNALPGMVIHPTLDRVTSWSLPASSVPIAFSVLNAELAVQAYINKRQQLNLGQMVNLDGSVTLELIYL